MATLLNGFKSPGPTKRKRQATDFPSEFQGLFLCPVPCLLLQRRAFPVAGSPCCSLPYRDRHPASFASPPFWLRTRGMIFPESVNETVRFRRQQGSGTLAGKHSWIHVRNSPSKKTSLRETDAYFSSSTEKEFELDTHYQDKQASYIPGKRNLKQRFQITINRPPQTLEGQEK